MVLTYTLNIKICGLGTYYGCTFTLQVVLNADFKHNTKTGMFYHWRDFLLSLAKYQKETLYRTVVVVLPSYSF